MGARHREVLPEQVLEPVSPGQHTIGNSNHVKKSERGPSAMFGGIVGGAARYLAVNWPGFMFSPIGSSSVGLRRR